MIAINYPQEPLKTKTEAGTELVFDPLRKAWVKLTPEEWVRQHFLQVLVSVMRYPAALIAVEREIRLGEMKKRFDILVFNRRQEPWMLVECKAMEVALSTDVIEQVLRYSIPVPAPYLIITNGAYCYGWERGAGGLLEMSGLPEFPET